MIRRSVSLALLSLVFVTPHVRAQSSTNHSAAALQRVVLTVAGTNDEWTPSSLTVHPGDLVIVQAAGKVRIGQYAGEVDANGSPAGAGMLQFKVGVGAGKAAGKSALHVAESSGELKFRVADSRYEDNGGEFTVDVLIVPLAAIPAVPSADVK